MKNILYVAVGLIIWMSACAPQKEDSEMLTLNSPDSSATVDFYLGEDGVPTYSATYKGKKVVNSSKLGFVLSEDINLKDNFKLVNSSVSTTDETWEQPWGEERMIRNHYNELKVELENDKGIKLNMSFMAFDNGVAFRYEFPDQEGLTEFEIMDELTEFNMTDNHTAWWIPAFAGNRYEYIYKESPLSEMDTVHTPVTFKTADGLYISLHEAALTDYSSMVIKNQSGNKLKGDLVPFSTTDPVKSYVKAPFDTPWRTIQLAENAGDLVTNYMILNLNEPNKLGDVSWFKPGKYVGIWWEMHIQTGTWESGPKHAATTENTKKYIDFAAKHGFDGVLVEGWNTGWDGNWMENGEKFSFTEAYPDYDIDELSKYATERDVYIIGHHETGAAVENYEAQLEDAFQFLEDHNMKAVKTGYVEHGDTLTRGNYHHGQYYVRHFEKVIKTGAEHHVAIVAHEPIKATGKRRTYPNMISREGARGQEYNAWAADGGNPPSHTTILPFTRLLGGPMDFTPGVFDITLPTMPNNQINTTLAKQLALYVVIYSPMQMACDLPENYEGKPGFQFIKDVAVDWETTKVLEAEIGDYMTIARQERETDNWYIGAITNEDPRTATINLDFLKADRQYEATIYRDADDAHYIDNPTDYVIEKVPVNTNMKLELKLASSGGAAIQILPIE